MTPRHKLYDVEPKAIEDDERARIGDFVQAV